MLGWRTTSSTCPTRLPARNTGWTICSVFSAVRGPIWATTCLSRSISRTAATCWALPTDSSARLAPTASWSARGTAAPAATIWVRIS
ncbi:hypothetical protein D3C87_1964010 [compost metagenome]